MRKEITVSFDDNGTNKTFKIRQMPVTQQQAFLIKLALCLSESKGAEFKFDLEAISAIGVGATIIEHLKEKGFSVFSGIEHTKLCALLAELTSCCRRVVGNFEQEVDENTIDDFIVLTRLQMEAFKLNFFQRLSLQGDDSESQQSQITVGKSKTN